jgi:hypothetical protein
LANFEASLKTGGRGGEGGACRNVTFRTKLAAKFPGLQYQGPGTSYSLLGSRGVGEKEGGLFFSGLIGMLE